ncbi:hypothetical protein SUGI_0211300 [Cryptomeria japonica]|nr:hypothetical protein SUGI_0211300 [Cryptomeria japonica]
MGITRELEIANRTLLIEEHENITDPLTGKEAAGCWTWDCSMVLAYYLTTPNWPPSSFYAKTVIELGAGTGVPGLTAALLGANILLAYELRYGTTECFKALKERGFRWAKVAQEDLDPEWQSEDIGTWLLW